MPPVEPRAAHSTRRSPTVLLIAALVLVAARVATGLYEERHPPSLPDLVHWRPIDAAVAEARQTRKPLLYDFTADWCAPCQTMKRDLFADREAAARIERMFVPVRVLDRRQEEGRNPAEVDSLQRRFHIESFPTLVVVPAAGGDSTVLVGYQGRQAALQQLAEAQVRSMMPLRFRPRAGSAPPR
jgi:thiol:disulfide interchange protein